MEWTTVQSKHQRARLKKAAKWDKKKTVKRVRFADRLVQDSPVKKFVPKPLPIRLTFGTFHTAIFPDQLDHTRTFGRLSSGQSTDVPMKNVFDRIFSDLESGNQSSGNRPCFSPGADSSLQFQNLNDGIICSRCLSLGHWASSCQLGIRCHICRLFGHITKFWMSKTWPKKMAKPMRCWVAKPTPGQIPTISVVTHPCLPTGDSSYPVTEQALPSTPPSPQQFQSPPTPFLCSSETPPTLPISSNMANFPSNPMLYVPQGMHIEQGWNRSARSRVALGGEPP